MIVIFVKKKRLFFPKKEVLAQNVPKEIWKSFLGNDILLENLCSDIPAVENDFNSCPKAPDDLTFE